MAPGLARMGAVRRLAVDGLLVGGATRWPSRGQRRIHEYRRLGDRAALRRKRDRHGYRLRRSRRAFSQRSGRAHVCRRKGRARLARQRLALVHQERIVRIGNARALAWVDVARLDVPGSHAGGRFTGRRHSRTTSASSSRIATTSHAAAGGATRPALQGTLTTQPERLVP